MKELSGKKNILWDFDGVIIDSHEVREKGFWEVLKDYPNREIEQLLLYHRKNGGLSRYVKFRYFFEEIRKEKITQEKINALAAKFSEIMRNLLGNKEFLIPETLNFLKNKGSSYNMHIISGSDGKELRYLCDLLELTGLFKSIEGSPTPKKILVKELLDKYAYQKNETVLIGDSINDYDAAAVNGIDFFGYNNSDLKKIGSGYLTSFT